MMSNEIDRYSAEYIFAVALLNIYMRCSRKHPDLRKGMVCRLAGSYHKIPSIFLNNSPI